MSKKRLLMVGGVLVLLAGSVLAGSVSAHHGWEWTSGEWFSVSGAITEYRRGSPHSELKVQVDSNVWLVELGQPWRNQRAGLRPEKLRQGREITAYGHRSKVAEEKRMQAVRLVIDGRNYDLYPGRIR